MAIATINPGDGQVIKTFEPLSDAQIEVKLQIGCGYVLELPESAVPNARR